MTPSGQENSLRMASTLGGLREAPRLHGLKRPAATSRATRCVHSRGRPSAGRPARAPARQGTNSITSSADTGEASHGGRGDAVGRGKATSTEATKVKTERKISAIADKALQPPLAEGPIASAAELPDMDAGIVSSRQVS